MDHNSGSSSSSWNDNIQKGKMDVLCYNRSMSTESSSSDKVSDMSDMINRLTTYDTWPDDVVTSATELTRCGLFYTGYKDEVRCCECGVKLQNWKMQDIPYERHKNASPNCKFMFKLPKYENGASNFGDMDQEHKNGFTNEGYYHENRYGKTTSNRETASTSTSEGRNKFHGGDSHQDTTTIPEQANVNLSEMNGWFMPRQRVIDKKSDFTIESNRLLSFAGNWPADAPLTADELVNAGFYFTGPRDRVQCAWCRGGLYNFEAGDSAIGEHIRHFPKCHFIRTKMNEMMNVRMSDTINNHHQRNNGSNHVGNQFKTNSQDNNNQNITQLPVVHIVTEMGYDIESIKKAIAYIGISPEDISSEQLIDALYDVENSEQDTATTTDKEENSRNEVRSNYNGLPMESENLDQLMEENERLKGKTICKICLDKSVNTLFLPCRHLVCCEECADAVQHCPVCRTSIVGTVQTFLS